MIFLLFACATTPSTCEVVPQVDASRALGTDPSAYEYCFADDASRGSFDRVDPVTCTGAIGGCSTDADCGDGQLCVCGAGYAYEGGQRDLSVLSQCVSAACTGPDDCDGFACGVALDVCGQPATHACRTANDACRLDADCTDNQYCGHDGTSWTCVELSECL